MTDQGILGQFCYWCGEPAVDCIAIEPAAYKTVTITSPKTGQLISAQQARRFAINAYVCTAHKGVCDREGGVPIPNWRRVKAEAIDQLGLFGDKHKPDNAIGGER